MNSSQAMMNHITRRYCLQNTGLFASAAVLAPNLFAAEDSFLLVCVPEAKRKFKSIAVGKVIKKVQSSSDGQNSNPNRKRPKARPPTKESPAKRTGRPSVMDLLAAHYQNDRFYRLIEQRWGQRAAVIMTKNRRAQKCEAMRQTQQLSKLHHVHI